MLLVSSVHCHEISKKSLQYLNKTLTQKHLFSRHVGRGLTPSETKERKIRQICLSQMANKI